MEMSICKNTAVITLIQLTILANKSRFIDHKSRQAHLFQNFRQAIICRNTSVVTSKPHAKNTYIITAFHTIFNRFMHACVIKHFKKSSSLGMNLHFLTKTVFLDSSFQRRFLNVFYTVFNRLQNCRSLCIIGQNQRSTTSIIKISLIQGNPPEITHCKISLTRERSILAALACSP